MGNLLSQFNGLVNRDETTVPDVNLDFENGVNPSQTGEVDATGVAIQAPFATALMLGVLWGNFSSCKKNGA
ncbi:hypothetical protein DFQ26_005276 [Actinomortierella ambigua]|nr:hypothetical protein DFQ26_005276 [Actinomortierella ambigua]